MKMKKNKPEQLKRLEDILKSLATKYSFKAGNSFKAGYGFNAGYRLKLEKEFRFHTSRKWRFDYAFPKIKLAIEFEGGIFIRGRTGHSSIGGMSKDIEKYNSAVELGWAVLRYNSQQLYKPKSNKVTKYSYRYVRAQINNVIAERRYYCGKA